MAAKNISLKTQKQLDSWIKEFNQPAFIENDPISIPHLFHQKQDIEISGLMTALISWGNRKAILSTARQWMDRMDHQPFAFVMNSSLTEQKQLQKVIYRTFQGEDMMDLLFVLKQSYLMYPSLEIPFSLGFMDKEALTGIASFRTHLLQFSHHAHFEKHLANPMEGSAAKRINMFLRWMVRKDKTGVDFGIWENIPMSKLSIPLDIHSGNVARHLGLLHRKQNDWKAVAELDTELRKLNPSDPVKFDFALFGAGVYNKIEI
jgi:uncharacterized protein (TIGR02757 family)